MRACVSTDMNLPPAHYVTPEHKEREELETMRDAARTAREANDDKLAAKLDGMIQQEFSRLNRKYRRDGTAWMAKLECTYPDGRVETLPEGRYDRTEHLGLSMRMEARHGEACVRAGYP